VICSSVSDWDRAEETVARVVYDHVDLAEIGEGLVHDLFDCRLLMELPGC
jgi:hypothetical protein